MALAFTSVVVETAAGTTIPGLRGIVQLAVVPSGQGAPLPSVAGSVAVGLSAGAAVA
eukprot:CAMPEP_0177255236 /NCGR_PEP_ID=MMETSP0367-20130122/56233_1 /TAXON_ID=447022 ORGANISM="Scrippsiella hangoei-like, Strain SHHI-4" /NCGR_SAMPLE_ID=MMETSP0367 /ASSEMBLY_ACC=CAM_ASM_000362 /LENGTH=56 /DNA_ID=CAMNT_0018708905 /DNA_START=10 /DNA_END=176 /DNA_ORIENTATION=+